MRKPDKGTTFITLLVIEIILSLSIGYSEAYGHSQLELVAHEYVVHPTPQNRTTLDAVLERVYRPERKRNRIVFALLIANSGLIAVVGYKLVRTKRCMDCRTVELPEGFAGAHKT